MIDNKIKIAFFDVDGTLASNTIKDRNAYNRIPESTKKALILLKENGVTPVVATGRGRVAIKPLIDQLKMDSFIAANGLSLTYKNEEIHKQFLNSEDVLSVLNQINDYKDIRIMLETSIGNVVCKRANPDDEENFVASIENDYSLVKNYDVYQITVIGKDIKERIKFNVDGLKGKMVAPIVMNIFPSHLSKAYAVEKMLKILNLDKSEAIAFGDEENDMEMFSAVAQSVAMGNGVEELKAIATYVTDDVDNDGIYKACKYFNLF